MSRKDSSWNKDQN